MAREQTVYSELALALGIIGDGAENYERLKDIENVTTKDISIYERESAKRLKIGEKMAIAGNAIRSYAISQGIPLPEVKWIGSEKIASMENAAKDLEIKAFVPIRISVKENSNVLINGSPGRIFKLLPLGDFERARSEDWYQLTAHEELNTYYRICDGPKITGHDTVEEYYKHTKGRARKNFTEHVKKLHDSNVENAHEAYHALCVAVSNRCADIFNENMHITRQHRNKAQRLELIFHHFFRINGVRYVLAGIDSNEPFAVILNDSSTWGRRYEFKDIKAIPKAAGQPEVLLRFNFKDKRTGEHFAFDLKAEIRWSHGKFCGNPESKLYKQWKFLELPWAEKIL